MKLFGNVGKQNSVMISYYYITKCYICQYLARDVIKINNTFFFFESIEYYIIKRL